MTTEFFAKFGRPVYTIEVNRRSYAFSRARLRLFRNVTLLLGDSREALRRLFNGQLQSVINLTIFFYLDAHWGTDLPLIEELEIIFAQCPGALVMIDDFQVPGDSAYGYDNYGPGEALTPAYIAPAVETYRLTAFFPATPAVQESGMRRGCVVLVADAIHVASLCSLGLLIRG
jgi:hypothetical protein